MSPGSWTGFTASPPVIDAADKVEQTKAAIDATRTNLAAYRLRPDASPHVIREALHRLGVLACRLRLRTWALKRARGY